MVKYIRSISCSEYLLLMKVKKLGTPSPDFDRLTPHHIKNVKQLRLADVVVCLKGSSVHFPRNIAFCYNLLNRNTEKTR